LDGVVVSLAPGVTVDGRFSVEGQTIDNGAQYDPEFLKQYEQQGKSLSIAEGSSNNVDVKLIPAR
jgi:hypothetical protein